MSTLLPAPDSLAEALADIGVTAQLIVERKDGQSLTTEELAAIRAIIACHEAESGRAVSDEEAMSAVGAVLKNRLRATGTSG